MCTHLAMFFRPRKPFRAPPDGSSAFAVTRSIFDMTFIQGISRLTMADMAERTPLQVGANGWGDAIHNEGD